MFRKTCEITEVVKIMTTRFFYCRVLLLSAIWPPHINAFLFSGLAHSQSWQRTDAEAMRYHISPHSSLLRHQHTAASFSNGHGLCGQEFSQSKSGSPHILKRTSYIGLHSLNESVWTFTWMILPAIPHSLISFSLYVRLLLFHVL